MEWTSAVLWLQAGFVAWGWLVIRAWEEGGAYSSTCCKLRILVLALTCNHQSHEWQQKVARFVVCCLKNVSRSEYLLNKVKVTKPPMLQLHPVLYSSICRKHCAAYSNKIEHSMSTIVYVPHGKCRVTMVKSSKSWSPHHCSPSKNIQSMCWHILRSTCRQRKLKLNTKNWGYNIKGNGTFFLAKKVGQFLN